MTVSKHEDRITERIPVVDSQGRRFVVEKCTTFGRHSADGLTWTGWQPGTSEYFCDGRHVTMLSADEFVLVTTKESLRRVAS